MKTTDSPPPKAARDVCRVCRISAAAPIVVDGKCTNAAACAIRVKRQQSATKPRGAK